MDRTKSPDSPEACEWLVAGLIAVNLVWTTLGLGGYRPGTMALSWVLTAAALATHFGFGAWFGLRTHPAGLWFLPFLGYALGNVLAVSPVPWIGWRDWMGWVQLVAVFWLMLNGLTRQGPRALVLGTVVVLGGVAVLLAAYQRFVIPDWLPLGRTQADQFIGRASGPFGIPNSLAAFLLLLIPPMLGLCWQRGAGAVQRVLFGYLAAVFLLGLGLTISRGAWLSLMLALILWPLGVRRLGWTSRVMLSATALAVAMLAGVILYSAVPKVKQRFDAFVAEAGERSRPVLWKASLKLFADAPLCGTGAGSFNTLFERHRPENFRDEPQWAHNDYLNTLSDYGLVGFVLLFGAAAAVTGRTLRGKTPAQAALTAESNTGWTAPDVGSAIGVGLAAFAVSLFVDFHFKIPALSLISALLAGEWVRRGWPAREPSPPKPSGQILALAVCLLTGLFALAGAFPIYWAEASRYEGRQAIDRLALNPKASPNEQRSTVATSAVAFSDALTLHAGNAQAWADRAYATELWARLNPSQYNALGREAETYARQALALSEVVPEFWIRLGVALDLQGRWADAGNAFVKAIELAPASSNVWFHHAYHLSLNPIANKLALASVENSLRLDPAHPLALALRQRLSSPSPLQQPPSP